MKCIGGPIDGKEIPAGSRYVEAMTEDFLRIARYEAIGSAYVHSGHFDREVRDGEVEWVFVPL